MNSTRRHFLISGLLATGGLAAAACDALRLEPQWLEVTKTRLRFFSTPGPSVRVLHLSDLHYSNEVPLDYISEAIETGLQEKPDFAVVTGDMVTGFVQDFPAYRTILQKLSAQVPVWCCYGNHDWGIWTPYTPGQQRNLIIGQLYEEAGWKLLNNASDVIRIGPRMIPITGIGDLWTGQCRPEAAFQRILPYKELPRMVISHNPDSKERLKAYPWKLMLCGHTHGGQMHVPLLGAPLAPVRDKRFVAGLYPWEGRHLYITRGIGNLHGIRINCRPEITIIDLV